MQVVDRGGELAILLEHLHHLLHRAAAVRIVTDVDVLRLGRCPAASRRSLRQPASLTRPRLPIGSVRFAALEFAFGGGGGALQAARVWPGPGAARLGGLGGGLALGGEAVAVA